MWRMVLPAVLLLAVPAQAAAQAEPIVVDAGGARAVIERSPFRLAITDGAGRPVLREVPNARAAPLVEPPTVDPSRSVSTTCRRRRSTRR